MTARKPISRDTRGRALCTAGRPWTPADGVPARHPDAVEVGEQQDGWPGGDLVTMRCPHCRVTWTKELPQ